jgi:glycosyltransferase involved in cell wall biosynthesis
MNTANDLVSVIVPSYNMAHFLPQAVQSALNQSYANLEVLIVDDGSTDDTAKVVRQWEGNPRVRVHRQANGGLSHARNQGIALTRGPFIALLDADDTWATEKIAWQMRLFAGRPEVGVVYSDFALMDREGKALSRGPMHMHRGWVSGALLIENFVPASAAVARRECFERYGGFDTNLRTGEDYDMWLRLSPHYQFDFVPEPAIRYRIWGGQMSKDYRARYETGIRTMERFLNNNPDVVDQAVVRRAWAHTYTGRGNVTLWRGRDRLAALRDYLRALSFRPGYWPAWRAILRSFITSREPT